MNFTADSEGWAGTKQRKKVAAANLASRDFRVGIIHGVTREGTKVENAVDMAVLNPDRSKIILGRKPGEDLLRFPGGMFDAGDDPHFEATASREIREETGVTVAHAEWKYICNRNVDDWRCRDSDEHFYHTTFFMAVLPWAAQTKADDDLEDADWHEISDIMPSMLVEEHRHLWDALEEYLNNNYPREEK